MNRNTNRDNDQSRSEMTRSIETISKDVNTFFTWIQNGLPTEVTRRDMRTTMQSIRDEVDFLRLEMNSLDSEIANVNAWKKHLKLRSIMIDILKELVSGEEISCNQLEASFRSVNRSIEKLKELVKSAGRPGLIRPLSNIFL